MRPLLTFALASYNQQRFIAEAVTAALAQTYSPLQVILSDDGSQDGTFQIIKDLAAQYRGPHQIVINRNDPNLGLAGHLNLLARLAKGELVIAAAGDDISLPSRAETLFDAWDRTGRRATYVHSRLIHIDDAGNQIRHPIASWNEGAEPSHRFVEQPASVAEYVRTLRPGAAGCTGAWSPKLLRTFGEMPADVVHEDNALTLRALVIGGVVLVDTPLVRYRLHETNLNNARHDIASTPETIRLQEDRMLRQFRSRGAMYRLFCQDLKTARDLGLLHEREFALALAGASRRERLCRLQAEFMTVGTLNKVVKFFRFVGGGGAAPDAAELLVRVLPDRAFLRAKLWRAWLRQSLRPARHGSSKQVGSCVGR